MRIKDVGKIKTGLSSEIEDGMIRLYDRIGYPRIELFAMRDEHGNLLEDDIDLIRLADNLIAVWNDACK